MRFAIWIKRNKKRIMIIMIIMKLLINAMVLSIMILPTDRYDSK